MALKVVADIPQGFLWSEEHRRLLYWEAVEDLPGIDPAFFRCWRAINIVLHGAKKPEAALADAWVAWCRADGKEPWT